MKEFRANNSKLQMAKLNRITAHSMNITGSKTQEATKF
jgi:hypothetical protein